MENALKAHPLIGQAMAYGDGRPYLVALLVLDPEAAARRPLSLDADVAAAVEAANATLNRAEQVKRYLVLEHEWGPETGELTPSLKLKRRVILQRYGRDIERLYHP